MSWYYATIIHGLVQSILRAKAAIVGIGELPTLRQYPGRSLYSLSADAARLAIADAGLSKEDIDGLITSGPDVFPPDLSEYIGISTSFTEGTTLMGASGAHSIALASMAIDAGLANHILCVFGGTRDPAVGGARRGRPEASQRTEFEDPYGPVVAANGGYALIKRRHMHEFGTTDEQFAKVAVDQRFNAVKNENAVFKGQPITLQDVLDSPMVSDPLHLLECVMPCAGAFACVVTSAERAMSMPNRPAYILGMGVSATHALGWQSPDYTTTPATRSAAKAFEMAGYGPKDMQFAEFYD